MLIPISPQAIVPAVKVLAPITKQILGDDNLLSAVLEGVGDLLEDIHESERHAELIQLQRELQREALAQQDKHHRENQALQAELARKALELQWRVANLQRETAMEQVDRQYALKNWPLRIMPEQLLTKQDMKSRPALKVLLALPKIDYASFGIAPNEYPDLEQEISDYLHLFINSHFSPNGQRPVRLLDRAWRPEAEAVRSDESEGMRGGAAIIALHSFLRSESILVLESKISKGLWSLRYAYWVGGRKAYTYPVMVVKGYPYLKVVQETPSHEVDFEPFERYLGWLHCLVVGQVADIHHLLLHDVAPVLPQWLKEMVGDGVPLATFDPVVEAYRQVVERLATSNPARAAEIAAGLASGLANLPNKAWGQSFLAAERKAWKEAEARKMVAGAGRYRLNGDGTVTDTHTKLMWKQDCEAGTYTWDRAMATFGRNVSFAGYNDWRMPTLEELKTLVDKAYYPTIHPNAFPVSAPSFCWSSTKRDARCALGVDFFFGNEVWGYCNRNDHAVRVRLVRSVQ